MRGELRCDGSTLRDWSADDARGWLAGLLDALEYPLGVNASAYGGTFLAVDVCVPPEYRYEISYGKPARCVVVAQRVTLMRIWLAGRTMEQIAEEVEAKVVALFEE